MSAIQSIQNSKFVTGFKNMSGKKKAATVVVAVALVASAIGAYKTGKTTFASQEGQKAVSKFFGTMGEGYKKMGAYVVNHAKSLKDSVVGFFHKAPAKPEV